MSLVRSDSRMWVVVAIEYIQDRILRLLAPRCAFASANAAKETRDYQYGKYEDQNAQYNSQYHRQAVIAVASRSDTAIIVAI